MRTIVRNKWLIAIIFLGCMAISSCSSLLNIGSSEFECPHIRSSQTKCMPPSVIEELDEEGKFDWKWHPLSKCEDKTCSLKPHGTCVQCASPSQQKKQLLFKGSVFPETVGN